MKIFHFLIKLFLHLNIFIFIKKSKVFSILSTLRAFARVNILVLLYPTENHEDDQTVNVYHSFTVYLYQISKVNAVYNGCQALFKLVMPHSTPIGLPVFAYSFWCSFCLNFFYV